MPGITGILGGGGSEGRQAALSQMVCSMMHEPFYTSGMYINEELELWLGWVAHRDSFSDGMPVWNEKRDICLIFSGEDFADSEAINRLRARGHDCTPGNASYLVHLYEEMGDKFYERLNGRFCGVLVDFRIPRVTLFNDRYGLSRIYYCEKDGGFHFSSEAKSLLRVCPELRKLDDKSFAETFSCGCVLQNRALFPGISKLPGGALWTFKPGQSIKKDLYFRPAVWENQMPLGNAEYHDKLKETWAHILPRYLQGTEQAGVSLTGGKDSRMIMAWAPSRPGTLPCYTFGGLYRDCEDVKLARLIAKTCDQPHQVIAVDGTFLREFPKLAERAVYISDGTMDVSGSTELFVNRLARQIAPVRLTGNYGQEVLRGAVSFKPGTISPKLFEKDFAGTIKNAAKTYDFELGSGGLPFVAFKQLPWHHYSRLSLEQSQLTVRSPFLDNDLVPLCFQAPAGLAENVAIQLRLIAEGNPGLARISTDRALLYQSNSLLDRVRQKYQELTFKAEYAFDYGMPQPLAKVDYYLKSLHLERLFLGRHKFYHFRIWYRDAFARYVKDVLLDPRTLGRPYLNGQEVERIVLEHVKGRGNYTAEIHRLLTSELIQRQLIE